MTNDLEEVSGIGKATADRLRASGIDTVEKLAKKMTLMTIAKNAGLVKNEEEMKAIWRSRKATTLDKQIELLEELTQGKNTKNNNNCSDGENCQRIVSEAELSGMLEQGWHVAAVLPSGKIVVSNEH